MLKAFGFEPSILVLAWYVSVLVVASTITYLLLEHYYQFAVRYMFPALALFILGWFYTNIGHLGVNEGVLGLLRGISGILIGCLTYNASGWVNKNIKKNEAISVAATIIEMLIFTYIFHQFAKKNSEDFFTLFLFAVLMISIFNFDSYLTRAFNMPLSGFLGKISFPMYLNQKIFIILAQKYLPGVSFWPVVLCIILVDFILSLCTERLTAFAVPKVAAGCRKLMKEEKD